MLEKDLVTKIKKALGSLPRAYFIKIPGTRYLAGVPDLIGCVNGTFVGLEVKRPDTSYGVTDRQQAHIDMINAAGGVAGVVTSVAEAMDFVQQLLPPKSSTET